MSEVVQLLAGIKDLGLLKSALEEMGFTVRLTGSQLGFSGVDKSTGCYQSGSYADGKLKTEQGLDLEMLKKYTAIANMKKQVAAANANSKYSKVSWRLTKVSEFNYTMEEQ